MEDTHNKTNETHVETKRIRKEAAKDRTLRTDHDITGGAGETEPGQASG